MNKVILITGASSGIGEGIARELGKAGAKVFLGARRLERIHALADEIRSAGGEAEAQVLDVTSRQSMAAFVEAAREKWGRIDVLINNAGISVVGLIQDLSIDDWNYIWNTNVTAPIFLSKELVPHFLHNHSGKIINISSVWGNVGASCEVAYSATKGAINSFTKALAKELAPSNIQVNAISCGIIDTDMNSHLSSDDINEIVTDIPAGRIGTPKDIALTALSLVNGSDYLTGQIITVDGGWI